MRISITAIAAAAALGMFAIPAMAQMQSAGADQMAANAPAMQSPKVEISSAGAPTTDLNMVGYAAFDEFAQEHPQIVRQLHQHPRLVNDPSYAQKHPEFAQFLKENPKVAEDLAENPGNYLAGGSHS